MRLHILIISFIFFSTDSWSEEFIEDFFKPIKHIECRDKFTVFGTLKVNEYVASSGGYNYDLLIEVDHLEKSKISESPKMKELNKKYLYFNWYLNELYEFERKGLTRKEIEELLEKKIPGNDMLSDYLYRKIKVEGIIFKEDIHSKTFYIKEVKDKNSYENIYIMQLNFNEDLIQNNPLQLNSKSKL